MAESMPNTFEQFSELCTSVGLKSRDCTNGHWQVIGGSSLVNFWPHKGTVYVNGSKGSYKGSMEVAVKAAGKPTEQSRQARGPRTQSGRHYSGGTPDTIIGRMLLMSDVCFWCGKGPLVELDAVIDYKLSMDRGGRDTTSNQVVSCLGCKDRRTENVR